MITDEEIRDLQDNAAHANVEADHAVDAWLEAAPGREAALWSRMADLLTIADDLTRQLRRAVATRKPADVPA